MNTATLTRGMGVAMLAALLFGVGGWPVPAHAQDNPCSCEAAICNAQGFQISLTDSSINQLLGQSSWTYELCVNSAECYCTPDYQNTAGKCRGLSHIDISLPDLGVCLSENQTVTIEQVGGDAVLDCVPVTEKDPACSVTGTEDEDFVAKCNVAEGEEVGDGECVSVRVTIAGELPSLGQGGASTVTKAGNACVTDGICGPACNCVMGQEGAECLTRTVGFWGTHPQITDDFLNISVCGQTLSTTNAGSCQSVTEALCVAPGAEANKKLDGNPAYAQLVRQLAAAKLNLAATAANDGDCGPDIAARIAQCEALCGANKGQINSSGCIADLTAFNESMDTFEMTPPPFDSPGPAMPQQCQLATGNGIIIGKSCQ